MAVLGGIVGAVAGFLLALLITEVLAGGNLSNHPIDWAFWTDILLTIIGAIAGWTVAGRFRSGNPA